jgi:hypothetical protein
LVDPASVPLVLLDAARLLKHGEIVVFGSAALAFSIDDPPRTRDIDVWCDPPERGDLVTAVMGELSWYHDRHGAYVEVWGPETFAAPSDWRERARTLTEATVPGVRLLVPHPHDVLVAKLERWEPADRDHAMRILATVPLSCSGLEALAARTPFRDGRIASAARRARFEAHLEDLSASLRSR